MSDFEEYKPMDVEHNVKTAVENLRKAYWSNETEKVAKHFTEAEDKIISAICHLGYTVCKETTEGDLISREALKKKIREYTEPSSKLSDDCSKGITECACEILDMIDNAPPVPERDYSQGWHDAITKALNEAYTITTEDGSFKVVQTETLEGLGMSMPDKKGECCGSCYLCDVGDCGADMKGGAE